MKTSTIRRVIMVALFLLTSVGAANATSVLYSDSGGSSSYGIGYNSWTDFTAYLNTATGGNLVKTSSFEDYGQMMQYDAIFVDQRWTGGRLSAKEIENISDYIATGRKVVMMGENSSFTAWNQQILGIVGGTFGGEYQGTVMPVADNSLTAGVGPIFLPYGGVVASGGTALFDYNFATVWIHNVLTVLDVNVFDNIYGDAQFEMNVANWIAESGPAAVPEPATAGLLGVGIVAVAVYRRQRCRAR